jgi:hypothetical protein
MSGETIKLVKVEDVAVRSLKQRRIRMSASENQCQQQVEAARKQAQQEFRQRLAAVQARTAQQSQQSKTMATQLGAIEQTANQELQRQQQQLQNLVQQASGQPTATQASQLQRQQFEQLIAQEQAARAQIQAAMQQQLQQMTNSLAQDQQRKQQFATNLLADVHKLYEQIDQGYAHQKIAPDRLAAVQRQLGLAQTNLQAGLSEAAIANAQQSYLNLTDLRLHLEQQEQACLVLHAATLEQIRKLQAEAQLARQCEVTVEQGAEPVTIAVDYWTNGRLSQYEQQLQQLEAQLTIAVDNDDQPQLQQLSQRIEALEPNLAAIIEQAQLAVFSSQMRAEIADSIVDALASLGYSLTAPETDAIYEGDDQRQAYVVKVQNLAGDEVVAVIRPEAEFGINSISVNAFSDAIVDETAAQQNAQAVFEALEAEGIQGISPLQCNSQARSEYRNLQAVKQRRVQSAPAPSSTAQPS